MLMIVTKLLGGLGTFLLAFKLLTENIEKIEDILYNLGSL